MTTELDWYRLIIEALRDGTPVDPSGLGPESDPSHRNQRTAVDGAELRSALVRALPEHPARELDIYGVKVVGDLNLSRLEIAQSIWFVNCEFTDELALVGLVAPELVVLHSEIGSIDASFCSIRGRLLFEDCAIAQDREGKPAPAAPAVTIRASDLGALSLARSTVRTREHPSDASEVTLQGTTCRLWANLEQMKVWGDLCVRGLTADQLTLDGSELDASSELDAQGLRVSGLASLNHVHIGTFHAMGMRVGAFEAKDARIDHAKFHTSAAEIYFDLKRSRIEKLRLDGISAGRLELEDASLGKTGVARTSWSLDLSGAALETIRVGGLKILGSALLQGIVVTGEIETKRFDAATETVVDAPATVDGLLDLSHGRLAGDLGSAVGGWRVGELDLSYATLGGALRVADFRPSRHCEETLVVRSGFASIARLAVDARSDSHRVDLDLTGAQIGRLDMGDGTPEAHVSVFRTSAWSINGPVTGRGFDADRARAWLERADVPDRDTDTGAGLEYAPIQPWHALADAFVAAGHDAEARSLRFLAADHHERHGSKRAVRYLWRPIKRWTIGHGYYPQRAIGWIIALWLLTAAIIQLGHSQFEPTDPALFATGDYPGFWGPLYALDVVLSPLGTGQAEAWWIPSSFGFVALLTTFKLVCWALLGLFVSGVTGLVSKQT